MAAVAVGVLASSCTRKAEGQTVAVVNGEEITVPDLNFALDMAKVPQGADKDQARSKVLDQLVDRRLLAEQARKEGIDKSPEYLNRVRRADEDLLISMLAARRLNTAQLPSDREVQAFMASHPGIFADRQTWDLDQVQYTTPKNPAFTADMKNAHSIDQLNAVLEKYKVPFTRQKNRLDTAAVPAQLFAKLGSLPAGEPFVVPMGDRAIASAIVGKEPHPLTGDEAKPVAVQAMRKTQTAKSLEGLLKSLKSSAKIEYQKGYGPPKKS
jgi:EpsD family peptidyl-prolyl cis-trans isomerase